MKNILLLHGALGSESQLSPLAKLLEKECTVHSINFTGHGGNGVVRDFTIVSLAAQVKDYILENQISPVTIFGYSMGGYVGMHLATKEPALVKSICTLATKFYWDEHVSAKEVGMLDAGKIEKKLPAFAEMLRQRHEPNDWKDLLEKTKQMLLNMCLENCLTSKDYAAISIPALVMVGDRDKMVSVDETMAVFRALPNAQMAVLPATGHPVEQVDLEQLAFQVTRFLNKDLFD